MGELVFRQIHLDPSVEAFNGAFLGQESYIQLLRLSDTYFDFLQMNTRDRRLPCQLNSYLLISREREKIWKGIGKKVSFIVDRLLYNPIYGILIALVQMKNNFTCNKVPHIVIAKNKDITNVMVSHLINEETEGSTIEFLYAPVRIHGKIGSMLNSNEEIMPADTRIINGLKIQETHKYVTRPEVCLTVEQSLTKKTEPLSFNEFKNRAQADRNKDTAKDGNGVMSISLDSKGGKQGVVSTGEIFRGETVMKGPRGGKYIIKDGKKIYVHAGKTEDTSDVVYKINILT